MNKPEGDSMTRQIFVRMVVAIIWLSGMLFSWRTLAAEPSPVVIGLTAEFGVQGSQAAQSIEKGVRLAIDEINAAGGVLDGRKLALETADDRGVPARGVDNYITFAGREDVAAVFCGRFSPVAIEISQVAGRQRLLLLDPWAAADPITSNPAAGNNVFRLSLIDTWAIEAMLEAARKRGFSRLALFAPNTAWGRSSEAAMLAWERKHGGMVHTTYWHNWGETDLGERIGQARAAGAQGLVMVANEAEGAPIVRRMAELPAAERLPILSHWGILGGDFAAATGKALQEVDLSVVHTFSFADPRGARARDVASRFRQVFGQEIGELHGQVGFAHAYDLTHLLARAIRKAGSLDRSALRSALERLDAYDGLLRRYARPFTPERHEALDRKAVRLGRYGADGMLRSIDSGTR